MSAAKSTITSQFIIDEEPVAVSIKRIVLTIIILVLIIFLFFHVKGKPNCDIKEKFKKTCETRASSTHKPMPSAPTPPDETPTSVAAGISKPTTTEEISTQNVRDVSAPASSPLKFQEKNDQDLIGTVWSSSDSLAQPSYIVASTYAPGDIATIASNPYGSRIDGTPLVIAYNTNETLTEYELAKNLNAFSTARRLAEEPPWIQHQQQRRRYAVNEPNLYGSTYSHMGNLYSEGTKYL